MANDSYTQAALANDQLFRNRVKGCLSSVAWEVLGESPTTPNHANRSSYARQVTRQVDQELAVVLPGLVMRPNVFNFETTAQYDFQTQFNRIMSATGDPDIKAQLMSDWD